MKHSIITGVGHYVPERIVTNNDLAKIMDTTDEWIRERTGIVERRYFDHTVDTVANMGTKASRMALERAGVAGKDVDFIIFATITPDYVFPGSGVLMQRELGLEGIGALDIRNACSGFIYGLSIADQFIKTGMYKTILVVGSEIQSSGIELTDRGRNVAVIFGDGAGAVVVQSSDESGSGILSTHLHADGRYAEELYAKDPGSSRKERLTHEMLDGESIRPYMNGNAVFKHAVVRFTEVIIEALMANQLQKEDIDLLIPHQANLRISAFIQQKLRLPDSKIYNNIQRYGNTTGASIPLAWSEAWEEGRIKKGDLVCLAAFGSGFTWASALVRW
jgi:3-oxoacyl-[acyl-carrier-protein] synthase III